jgi:endonuclease/exonuclease/phosphatase family metal-dependent hydrolase
VATYNIHKGVRGLGPRRRLEIHNLGLGIAALDADLVFLQEVRLFHHRDARHFDRTWFGWPEQGQADFLAPDGYESAYRTNAITRDGEHGNALLSRWPLGEVEHHDVSDHRFEQRGLLHVVVQLQMRQAACHRGAFRLDPCEPGAPGPATVQLRGGRGAGGRSGAGGRGLQRLGRAP